MRSPVYIWTLALAFELSEVTQADAVFVALRIRSNTICKLNGPGLFMHGSCALGYLI
jgi:hypothetical protein